MERINHRPWNGLPFFLSFCVHFGILGWSLVYYFFLHTPELFDKGSVVEVRPVFEKDLSDSVKRAIAAAENPAQQIVNTDKRIKTDLNQKLTDREFLSNQDQRIEKKYSCCKHGRISKRDWKTRCKKII